MYSTTRGKHAAVVSSLIGAGANVNFIHQDAIALDWASANNPPDIPRTQRDAGGICCFEFVMSHNMLFRATDDAPTTT